MYEIIGRKQGNRLEVLCRYHFVEKLRPIKLKGLLQNLVFLKALTITKDFTENAELNKCRSRLVAALK